MTEDVTLTFGQAATTLYVGLNRVIVHTTLAFSAEKFYPSELIPVIVFLTWYCNIW